MKKNHIHHKKNNMPLTIADLGKFTDEVIFPGVERIVDEKFNILDEKFNILDERIGTIKEEIMREMIQSNDRVMAKLDIMLKEDSAHSMLHRRITDDLENYNQRIKKLEKVAHA